MRELIADRREEEWLVCSSGNDTVLVPCPDIIRPEGDRVLLFEAIGERRTPYVSISAPFARQITVTDASALLIPPDASRQKEIRQRFDRIFKSSCQSHQPKA